MISFGGSNLEDMVRRVLKSVMDRRLRQRFSLYGLQGNLKLHDSILWRALIRNSNLIIHKYCCLISFYWFLFELQKLVKTRPTVLDLPLKKWKRLPRTYFDMLKIQFQSETLLFLPENCFFSYSTERKINSPVFLLLVLSECGRRLCLFSASPASVQI